MKWMTVNQLKERLTQSFPQSEIEVADLTGTQNHFEVSIISQAFAGLSRIEQHQKVMAVFSAELKTGEVHALALKTRIP